MPPASRSRSMTVTGSMPSRRSSIAAASPAGPPPTITCPSVIAIAPSLDSRVDLPAGDPLAEADDPAEVGLAADQLAVLVGTGAVLADVEHPEFGRRPRL